MLRLDHLRPRILVTGIGGPAAQAFIDAFEPGAVEWIVADMDPAMPGFQLFDPDRRAVVPGGDDPQFVDELFKVALQTRVDMVVPTVDAELLPMSRERARFSDAGIDLLLADERTLAFCLDKLQLCDQLSGRVNVPRTSVLDDGVEADAIAGRVVTKPRSGSGGRGIRMFDSVADIASDVPRDGSHLVQEHLPGTEYSIDVLASREGQVVASVPRERIRTDSGIATVARTVRDQDLERFGKTVAEAIGLNTVANVQVKLDGDGKPALLEVNPRFPGTMGATVAAGVNMPRLAVTDWFGGSLPTRIPFREVAMVRTWGQTLVDPSSLGLSALTPYDEVA